MTPLSSGFLTSHMCFIYFLVLLPLPLNFKVPQCSFLGALLCLHSLSDLINFHRIIDYLYASDSQIYTSSSDIFL